MQEYTKKDGSKSISTVVYVDESLLKLFKLALIVTGRKQIEVFERYVNHYIENSKETFDAKVL